MRGSVTGQYRFIWRRLKREYRRLTNTALSPTRIISDFDTSIKTAAETEFPDAIVSGCFFHFIQNIYRQVMKLGLTRSYENNASARLLIRKLMALAFLPSQLVDFNFSRLVEDRPTIRLCRRSQGFQRLLAYFKRTYLNGQYIPTFWNVHNRTMDNRTNNFAEGMYNDNVK